MGAWSWYQDIMRHEISSRHWFLHGNYRTVMQPQHSGQRYLVMSAKLSFAGGVSFIHTIIVA